MDSLGEYLKEARLKANLSIEKIIEDTHIVKKFIEAIEAEEFSAFPGEAYLKGFLRTYSDYLGLDSDDVIKKYERIKMMETPTPMEQLIPKPKPNLQPLIIIVLLVFVISSLVVIGVFVVRNIIKNNTTITDNTNNKNDNTNDKNIKIKKNNKKKNEAIENIFTLTEPEKSFDKLKKGDVIEFELNKNKEKLTLKELIPAVVVSYKETKELLLIQGYQHKIDINEDNNQDIILTLNYWDSNNANISFKLLNNNQDSSNADFNASEGDNPEILFTKPNIEDVNIMVRVTKETFLRYKVDNFDEYEKYYYAGDSLALRSKEMLVLWLSNAGSVSIYFSNQNKDFIPGESGKIEVKMFRWKKNLNNEYDFIASSLK